MDLRWKIVLPVAAAAASMDWILAFAPISLPVATLPLLAAIIVAIVTWCAVNTFVQQPLQKLQVQSFRNNASSDPRDRLVQGDPFAGLAKILSGLRSDLAANQQRLVQEHDTLSGARQALRESEERYALAVRGANDGLWEWDLKSDQMYLSPRWKAMLGFSEAELSESATTWKACVVAEDRARVERALRKHLDGESERFESEHRVVHKDLGHRWVLSRGMAIRHANGTAYRMVGLDTETTNYKRVEEVMRHVAQGTANATGEEFLRQLVRHFAAALSVRVVWVTRCLGMPVTRLRTVVCWEAGEYTQKEYLLEPTPCKRVIELGETYFIPEDLTVLYPLELKRGLQSYLGVPIFDSRRKILGHLVFKDDKKMDASILMESVLQIFTARAGIELERMEAQQNVLQLVRERDDLGAAARLEKIAELLNV